MELRGAYTFPLKALVVHLHLVKHVARLLAVQVRNVESLLVMQLLTHQGVLRVCRYLSLLHLADIFLQVYDKVFLIVLWR
jgi:hypothetical protein